MSFEAIFTLVFIIICVAPFIWLIVGHHIDLSHTGEHTIPKAKTFKPKKVKKVKLPSNRKLVNENFAEFTNIIHTQIDSWIDQLEATEYIWISIESIINTIPACTKELYLSLGRSNPITIAKENPQLMGKKLGKYFKRKGYKVWFRPVDITARGWSMINYSSFALSL